MERIAKIGVGAAIYAIDKAYSYRVPDQMRLEVGMRVVVPFGRGNRRSEGVVLEICPLEDGVFKTIEEVLDTKPILSPAMLRLASWMRGRYFCTMYEAVHGMLPAGFWFATQETYQIAPEMADWRKLIARKPGAIQVMEFLVDMGGQTDGSQLRKAFPDEGALEQILQYLFRKKVLLCDQAVSLRLQEKMEVMVSLAVQVEEVMVYAQQKKTSAPLHFQVLSLLSTVGAGSSKEICYFTGCSMTTLKRLETLGYVALSKEPMAKFLVKPSAAVVEPIVLNPQQKAVFVGLETQMNGEKPGIALLYGVTGSGKTAVYIQLIQSCLAQGKTALVLVPEIGLTPQLLGKFSGYFGEKVAVLHSGLSMRKRYDQWKMVERGQATVVVGTRSAVFAPLENLGLLILDEEQESSYLSENKPRYDAREIAMYRGMKEGALVLFGSATPSVEAMYRAQNGAYALYTLPQRFNGQALPNVEIVDMKEELKAGNGTSISRRLEHLLQDNLEQSHQSILFLNRRGASRCLVCVDCGTVPICPRCSVHLTYHTANGRLMCHYCGFSQPKERACSSCGGHLKEIGTGTQKVQEELREKLPNMAVIRMDADTITGANPHEKVLEQFEKDRVPVMIGTQMVAKGLDFENVTLVGVLDGDSALYCEHYAAAERTFSLISQVVGRAGRGKADGLAVIQTMTPDHAVIALAAQQDYDGFYNMEIQMRKLRNAPPFSTLFTVHFSGIFEEQVRNAAKFFAGVVQSTLPAYPGLQVAVLGPAPEVITRINNRFRYQLTMCGQNSKIMRQMVSQVFTYFTTQKNSKGITAFVDINR